MCIGSTSILCARRVGVADVGSGEAGGVSPLCGRWVGGRIGSGYGGPAGQGFGWCDLQ